MFSSQPVTFIAAAVLVLVLLASVGALFATAKASRYSLRPGFLTPAERQFLTALRQAFPEFQHFAQVRLADILQQKTQTDLNRISQKSVDFVLCKPDYSFVAVIELDDKTHRRRDRRERDDFVNSICTAVGLPIVRIPVSRNFHHAEIRDIVLSHLSV